MLRPRDGVATAHRFVLTAVTLLFTAVPAQAQGPDARSGFWLSLGAGSGWDIPGTIRPTEWPDGVSAFLRAGGTLTPQVLFGAEVIGRSDRKGDLTEYRGNVTFMMLIFPSPSGRFFIKGGIGPAIVGESHGGGYRGTYTMGLGLTGGIGLDLNVMGNFSVTPSLDYVHQSFHAGENRRITHRLLLATFGLTWR